MSGDDVQEEVPTVLVPLGGTWWVVTKGEDDQEFATEEVASMRATDGAKVEYRIKEIEIRRPTEGQMLVLTRVMRMIEDGKLGEAILYFGDVLDEMIVKDADRDYAYQGLIKQRIRLDEYADVASTAMRHFGGGELAVPATRRRRATARPRR